MKDRTGQTIIETALILTILLMLVLGITEFSRAWFTKNTLKNAVRQGARKAVVTSGIGEASGGCPSGNVVISSVCGSPGMATLSGVNVSVKIDKGADNTLNAGDTVTVEASHNFNFVVGGGIWPWAKNAALIANASMRYEL